MYILASYHRVFVRKLCLMFMPYHQETVSEELPPSRARIMHLERRKQALLMKRMALEEKIKGLQEKRAARNLADTTRSTQSKP